MRGIAVFLTMALGLTLWPLRADDMTKIQVVVSNDDGKPVDNASVIVTFVSGRSKVKLGRKVNTTWEMKTSQEGVAKMPSVPKGKVLVQVIAKHYQTFGKTFDVQDDEKTIAIKLSPPQPQYSAHPN